jgi:phosphorylcholine metabolism protein LicD
MAGDKIDKAKLNNTLYFIVQLLHKYSIKNWFIAYGTLLGIVRDNSCIHNDDDVDIVCDISAYDLLKEGLLKEGFDLEYGYGIRTSKNILKTKPTNELASIDIYMAKIDDKGNFHDLWEKVVWSNCYENQQLVNKEWNNITLQLPNNYITKLENRYGNTWMTPQNSKGTRGPVL